MHRRSRNQEGLGELEEAAEAHREAGAPLADEVGRQAAADSVHPEDLAEVVEAAALAEEAEAEGHQEEEDEATECNRLFMIHRWGRWAFRGKELRSETDGQGYTGH